MVILMRFSGMCTTPSTYEFVHASSTYPDDEASEAEIKFDLTFPSSSIFNYFNCGQSYKFNSFKAGECRSTRDSHFLIIPQSPIQRLSRAASFAVIMSSWVYSGTTSLRYHIFKLFTEIS